MAKIDKFIEAALGHGADAMILSPGEKIHLSRGGVLKPLSSQPLDGGQIQGVLLEVAPAERRSDVEAARPCEFPYLAPAGAVRVSLDESGTARIVSAELSLVGALANANGAQPLSSPSVATGSPNGHPSEPQAVSGAPHHATNTAATVAGGESGRMDDLLCRMVQAACSDLHLSAAYPPLYRKDGDITDLGGEADLSSAQVEALVRSITPEAIWKEFLETHDVDFSYEILGVARFRCNLFVDRHGPGGVFRTIPSIIPSAEQLGLPKVVIDLCDLHKGLVVVTGPTGSGKSTTLASMIDHINRTQARHIITIEDPIEFVHPKRRALINQREIGAHTGSFRSALRAALREDPDIVLLGEMRDLETVEIALETAETGHLVFGTLHTNTAASTVDRIIDQFPPDQQAQIRVLLSETLKGVIAQTLCKKKGGGRVAAQEILLITPAISNLIREGKTFQIPSLMQTGKAQGMQTLDSRLLELVQAGAVAVEEAYAKSLTRTEFKSLLERNGLSLPKAA